MNDNVRTMQKFLSANREFKHLRIKNRKLEIMLAGSESTYVTADFTLKSLLRNKLEELEKVLNLPPS